MNLSYLSIGSLHLSVFGLFAALGLMAALLLTQRTAPLAGLPAQRLWNAGMIAVLLALVVSRILLVAAQPKTFLAQPMTVLALPSQTLTGMWISCLLMWVYLRMQRLPVLAVLDAAAPCGAVVWLALSLGHFAEGTAAGMPTRMPWGMRMAGDTMMGRVHPTQLYTAMAALLLLAVLLWMLRQRRGAGETAGVALLSGGLADFLIGMLRQPDATYGESWLDPSQTIALLLVLGGGLVLAMRPPAVSREETLRGAEAVHAK